MTPQNKLQFVYRSGVSGNGAGQLAEYSGGVWTNVGSWASASGSYTSDTGAVSTARNLYIHGFTYDVNGKLHVSGTWRENNAAVSCSSSGLANHDTVYFYSNDYVRDSCQWSRRLALHPHALNRAARTTIMRGRRLPLPALLPSAFQQQASLLIRWTTTTP